MKNSFSHNASAAWTNLIQKPWLAVAAIVLLALPLFFFGSGAWGFLDPDEGRYGTIPYEMLTRTDFITPRQNQVKFFDKPPLLYWGIAASYSLFGFQEWAARLVPALAALVSLLAAYMLGRRMFGARAGIIGAVVLATSLMWPIMARFIVTDMLVSALVFVSLALWWMGHSEKSDDGGRRQTWYFLGFWVVLALAALAKGPIALVLTGGCIFLYMLSCRQWRAPAQMRWLLGVPLFLLLAAPWFIAVAQRNPEFNHFFWYDQHIGRFLGNTTGNDHVQGVGYYFKLIPLILFPWSIFVPAAAIAGWGALRNVVKVPPSEKQRGAIYLLCGVAFTLLFFSSSSGKLVTYILPIVPLSALLFAAYFDRLLAREIGWNRALSVSVAALVLLLTVGGAAIMILAPSKLRSLGVDGGAPLFLGVLLLAWAIGLVVASRRLGLTGTLTATAGGFCSTFVAILALLGVILPRFTTEPLVDYIRPGLESSSQAEVLTINHIRSIPFYTRQRVEILGVPDELKFGVAQMPVAEKRAWIFDDATKQAKLREEMLDPYPVYCFIQLSGRSRKRARKLMGEVGNGAAFIAANEKFLVFGNRAALAVTPPLGSLDSP